MKTKHVSYLNNAEHKNILIRLEDWNEDYSFFKPFQKVVAYPISKKTKGFIKEGKPFRLALNFENEQEATHALNKLISNEATFKDYLSNIERSSHMFI
ncbi:hypothetical protein [Staphylococcus equorum]|uniref:Uncharacterized protein n=1 Tax=Staphylococcus equorum TaxID=246432 RepID=A0AAP7IFY0_9STAP|nr:hypothetical protein [Staphylococcus equorum]OEK58964.1 hypothetical protein ASS94_01160 [Staphylococcus equorum]